jgi:hypothetical protein
VNTIDFFAVIVPGFYVTCVLSLFAFAFVDRPMTAKSPWAIINGVIAGMHVNGAIFILLASHLLGSMIRVCFRRGRPEIYNSPFPYPIALERRFRNLGGFEAFDIKRDPTKEPDIHITFNYWKAEICQKSADLYAHTFSAEARVRMFAGIIWATGIGLALGIVQLVCPATRRWWEPVVLLIIVSFIICIIFLSLLREVRNEEARTVFFAYLTLHKREQLSNPADMSEL